MTILLTEQKAVQRSELETPNQSPEPTESLAVKHFAWQAKPPAGVKQSLIEDIPVDIFPTQNALFDRIAAEIQFGKILEKPRTVFSINIHGANMATRYPRFKKIMQTVDTMICDGIGIVLGSKMAKTVPIPCRHCAGDFLPDLVQYLADKGLTCYFLASEPGVAERAVENMAKKTPNHTILGYHHGYVLKDKVLENKVIDEINTLKPDILFVGFGMPLQEFWIEDNLSRLNVGAVFPFGATLDYISQKVPRCPVWLGQLGLEWLFRFCLEPKRMFERYIQGNPWFMYRILKQRVFN
ncbi:MAG: WecB/TagA/CpsF family glycosyltransferase [Cyanobacteria bacterium P01_H01_bin.74]